MRDSQLQIFTSGGARHLFTTLGMYLLLVVVFTVGGAQVGVSQTTCVDYWAPGPANCQPKKPEKSEDAPRKRKKKTNRQAEFIEPETEQPFQASPQEGEPKEEMTEEEKKEAKMKKDIDKFYQRHGKPPEEFVRFHMDPSPANAIAWAKKYNENLERSQKLSAAWTQAQEIYDKFEEQGMEIPDSLLPKHARENDNALPEVQDFDIDLPPGMAPGMELPPGTKDLLKSNDAQKSSDNTQEMSVGSLNVNGADFSVAVAEDGRIGANLPPEALTDGRNRSGGRSATDGKNRSRQSGESGDDPLEISYYFSADCPYCKKFEPGFSKILEQMESNPKVTCVDMTPTEQTQANVHGNIDCEWRPLMQGEMKKMGIEATPTLIVDRGGDKPLERLSGFVDEKRLRDYLFSK